MDCAGRSEVSTDEAYQAEPIGSETAETVAVGLWWDMDNSPETVTLAQHMWDEEWTAPVEAQVSTDEAYQAEPITSETAETVAVGLWWDMDNSPETVTLAQHMW